MNLLHRHRWSILNAEHYKLDPRSTNAFSSSFSKDIKRRLRRDGASTRDQDVYFQLELSGYTLITYICSVCRKVKIKTVPGDATKAKDL